MTLLSPSFVLQEVTRNDIIIASTCWGFTLGFGWLTTWMAGKQTYQAWKRTKSGIFRNPYIWMIWLEILVCLSFGIICILHLMAIIPPSFAFYFCILTLWALQVQFLLQIIINRCALLIPDRRFAWRLKVGVAILITAINISVYNIWIPARLQINDNYVHINEWWDRCEKVIYLIADGALNFYFVLIVRRNLVQNGLQKYNRLVHFNMFIIGFSLAMDVLIISMMSLKNTFVYMQFHPLAYIVKLKIEMSMADLIGRIARQSQNNNGVGSYYDTNDHTGSRSRTRPTINRTRVRTEITATLQNDIELTNSHSNSNSDSGTSKVDPFARGGIYTTKEVHIDFEDSSHENKGSEMTFETADTFERRSKDEEDTRPLKNHAANNAANGTGGWSHDNDRATSPM